MLETLIGLGAAVCITGAVVSFGAFLLLGANFICIDCPAPRPRPVSVIVSFISFIVLTTLSVLCLEYLYGP